nr:PKD domain-containing protein [uncultured Methanospirillum sp.]
MHSKSGLKKISLCLLVLLACGVFVCTAEPANSPPGINTTDLNDPRILLQETSTFSIPPPPINISDTRNLIPITQSKDPSVSTLSFADTKMTTMGDVILVPITPTPEGSGYSYFNTTGKDQSYYIYSPGTYTLQSGFSTGNSSAITIGTSDVVLDGNAQTITGNTTNLGIATGSDVNNTTVRNFFNIETFAYGLWSYGDKIYLANNSWTDNSYAGVVAFTSNLSIHKNTLKNTSIGVYIFGPDALVSENTILENYMGLYSLYGDGMTVEMNSFNDNLYGFVSSGDNLTFRKNTVHNNQDYGVIFQSNGGTCDGNIISQNYDNLISTGPNTTITGNTISDTKDEYGYGIRSEGKNTTFSENTLYNNGYGIMCYEQNGNAINNRIYSSNLYGILMGDDNGTISKNIIRNTNLYGIGCFGNNSQAHDNIVTNALFGIGIDDTFYNISVTGNQINGSSRDDLMILCDFYYEPITGPGIGEIYNNYFGGVNNIGGYGNFSNYSYVWTNPSGPVRGTNVVGGPFIAGNYWSNLTGTGWSDQQTPNVSGFITPPFVTLPPVNDTAPLVPLKPVTVNATANDQAIIVPAGNNSYRSYTNQTFITQPKPGADMPDVIVDYESKGNVTSWTFTNLTSDHDIQAIGNPTPGQVHVFFNASERYGERPLTVSFSSEQSLGSPTSWYWQFGDGITNTTQNPVHIYDIPGTYTVSLRALNNQTGGYGVWNNYITVTDGVVPEPTQTPVPGKIMTQFSAYPASGNAPLIVDFRDKSTGNPVTWDWDFGDGAHSSLQNPSHEYSTAGSYPVTLSVKNENYGASLRIPGAVVVT